MKQPPLVSVICLSMNHEKFIEKSFHSLITQTYPNIEILYADNFSNDASFEKGDVILKNSGLNYQSFKRERCFNISENINFLTALASGKYISLLSADDWWAPSNLEERISYFEAHNHYGMLHGSGFLYYHDTGIVVPEKILSKKTGGVFKDLLKRNFINTIGIVIKKEVLNEVGPFDECSPLEDWDMWLRISERYEVGFQDKRLVYYGKHSSNISENKIFMAEGYNYIFSKYQGHPEIKAARKYYRMVDIYETVKKEPGPKSLLLLLRNFDFTIVHFNQLIKALIYGIIK